MRWEDIDQQVCSVARTLAVVGDRWTLLILRDAFLGTHRFEDFRRQLGVSRHRLTERLNKLVDTGVLERVLYQQRPPRYEYRLTAKGLDLHGVVLMLGDWGNRWCSDESGAPVEYRHRTCGQLVRPMLSCSECGEPMAPTTVSPEVGPGLQQALACGVGMFAELGEGVELHEKLPPLLYKSLTRKPEAS
ncbi:helix-turn-helix transcriptional regulator [Aestuariicella hydrocarbonica]|uniref:Helix-turn-helix transcriptional regulator n=1 Tax=Pseudomaricurvus hydrocarbonicus TaxID=1470433 RepID=A0A9E5T499_9GAMM|nr:helix-turn-helix transcriptional regulator [Aestuariicella hydrocarbonica]